MILHTGDLNLLTHVNHKDFILNFKRKVILIKITQVQLQLSMCVQIVSLQDILEQPQNWDTFTYVSGKEGEGYPNEL